MDSVKSWTFHRQCKPNPNPRRFLKSKRRTRLIYRNGVTERMNVILQNERNQVMQIKTPPPKQQPHNRSRKTTKSTKDLNAGKTDQLTSIVDIAPVHEVQVNKVSASLSSAHIIDSNRIHNTRKIGSRARKHTNPRSARSTTKVDYSTFYNSEDTTTESSPSPKRTRTIAEI